jgi:hypothetical protein
MDKQMKYQDSFRGFDLKILIISRYYRFFIRGSAEKLQPLPHVILNGAQ